MIRPSVIKAGVSKLNLLQSTSRTSISPLQSLVTAQQTRYNSNAISNPTLANIESRWEQMPPQEQADLWMALRDRMKVDWKDLSAQEKKAAYWIAFGPHGPRAEAPPGETAYVVKYTLIGLVVSVAIFGAIRAFANPAPRTMTKEWQEATNEYLKEQKAEPITGFNMIQSPPSGKPIDEE